MSQPPPDDAPARILGGLLIAAAKIALAAGAILAVFHALLDLTTAR